MIYGNYSSFSWTNTKLFYVSTHVIGISPSFDIYQYYIYSDTIYSIISIVIVLKTQLITSLTIHVLVLFDVLLYP